MQRLPEWERDLLRGTQGVFREQQKSGRLWLACHLEGCVLVPYPRCYPLRARGAHDVRRNDGVQRDGNVRGTSDGARGYIRHRWAWTPRYPVRGENGLSSDRVLRVTGESSRGKSPRGDRIPRYARHELIEERQAYRSPLRYHVRDA